MAATRDLHDCEPRLGAAVESLIQEYNSAAKNGLSMRPICVSRSAADQILAFKAGLSPFDGITKQSKHQLRPSQAVDVGVFDAQGRYLTSDVYYKGLIELAAQFGLRSGWTFPHKDPDHLEAI